MNYYNLLKLTNYTFFMWMENFNAGPCVCHAIHVTVVTSATRRFHS